MGLRRYAKAAGVGIASLGLALSANAASVKLGGDGGALIFDPATITIKAGESVTWTNNVGFPHNVVFDEDAIPVRVCRKVALSRSKVATTACCGLHFWLGMGQPKASPRADCQFSAHYIRTTANTFFCIACNAFIVNIMDGSLQYW